MIWSSFLAAPMRCAGRAVGMEFVVKLLPHEAGGCPHLDQPSLRSPILAVIGIRFRMDDAAAVGSDIAISQNYHGHFRTRPSISQSYDLVEDPLIWRELQGKETAQESRTNHSPCRKEARPAMVLQTRPVPCSC